MNFSLEDFETILDSLSYASADREGRSENEKLDPETRDFLIELSLKGRELFERIQREAYGTKL
ncbi:hypothetical protein ACFQS3_02505 [Glycomyces mayteni]|uniref:Uncharacterized protein n=1 Tax=Glycomyces mayteni TaxID=543887 RepID=A0ABW2D3N2_9ACTN|nr:hypothetical protein GCM10025732_48000 [Glycomyces mayteni]